MRVRASLVIATVVVAIFTGCGPVAPTPSSTSPSTANPTPTSAPLPAAPAAQVPLDCRTAIPDATLEAVIGQVVPFEDGPSWAPFFAASQAQQGNLWCTWRSESPYALVFITVERDGSVRFPAEYPQVQFDGGFGLPQSYLTCLDDPGGGQCQVVALVDDYLVWAHVSFGSSMSIDRESAVHQLFDPAFDTLATAPIPARWTTEAGDWPLVVDCTELAARVDPPAAAGVTGMTVRDITADRDGYVLPREVAAIGGMTSCRWTPTGGITEDASMSSATVSFLAGGAWLWADLMDDTAATIEPLDLEGADESALVCLGGSCSVVMRYGRNTAQVTGYAGYINEPRDVSREDLLAMAGAVGPVIPEVIP